MIALERAKGKEYGINKVNNCVFDGMSARQYLHLLFDFKVIVPGWGEYFVNVLLYLCWGGGGSVALPLTCCRVGHVHKCFRVFTSCPIGSPML